MASYASEYNIREGLRQIPDIRPEGVFPVTFEIPQVNLDDLVKTVGGFVKDRRDQPRLCLNIQVVKILRI